MKPNVEEELARTQEFLKTLAPTDAQLDGDSYLLPREFKPILARTWEKEDLDKIEYVCGHMLLRLREGKECTDEDGCTLKQNHLHCGDCADWHL